MEFQDLILRLGLALGIGLLIGLERGWRMRDECPGSRTAGIRTFALTGLLGGATGALAQALGGQRRRGIVIGCSFCRLARGHGRVLPGGKPRRQELLGDHLVAAMTTFALGTYALLGNTATAAALAVAAAAILALREPIHDWVRADDLARAALRRWCCSP